jgi:hypothetical protein
MIDPGHAVTVSAKAAHLRQEVWHRSTLGEARVDPGSGCITAAEYPRGSGQVRVRRNQQ